MPPNGRDSSISGQAGLTDRVLEPTAAKSMWQLSQMRLPALASGMEVAFQSR